MIAGLDFAEKLQMSVLAFNLVFIASAFLQLVTLVIKKSKWIEYRIPLDYLVFLLPLVVFS